MSDMTFVFAALAFLPKLVLGFSIAHLIWANEKLSSLLMKFAIGIPLGMGIVSVLLFFAKWAALNNQTYIVIELTIVIVVVIATVLVRGNPFKGILFDVNTSHLKQDKGIILILASAIIISLFSFFTTVLRYPHGREDAWSNWNLIARFIYHSDDLSNAVDYIAASTFPGYPFMIGLDVATGWIFLNSATTRIPIVLAGLFTISIPAILFLGLLKNKGIQIASIATIIVMGPWLSQSGASLMSDVPMAAYYLGASVLISFYYCDEEPGLATLAGLLAGFSSWVKNDGIPFLLITSGIMLLISFRKRNVAGVIGFALGLALPLAAVFTYREFLAVPGNIVTSVNDMLPRLLDPARFQTVLFFFIEQTYYFGSPAHAYTLILLAILIIGGVDIGNENALFIASIFLMQYAAYFAVYMITPLTLTWHLNTSMSRVFVHIAPLLAFSVFSLLRAQNFPLFKPAVQRVDSPTSTPTAD
jgi:hypothetical protein